jgi:three-Cys-motif partner protein
MSDELPTIWPAEAHTLAKHGILKTYLEAWGPILSNARTAVGPELLFVDGFAGPGEYSTGDPGSPLLDHTGSFPKPVRFKFIEKDKDRYQYLCGKLSAENARISASTHVRVDPPVLGECEPEVRRLIGERKAARRPLGPALFFFDQFGYSQVSMSLLAEIMKHDQCEVFSYLNCQRLLPYLTDPIKAQSITDAYGSEAWREAISLSGQARQDCLITTYKNAIRDIAKANFPWSFAMFSDKGQLLHWLVFSTKNLSGLENMKRAMWRADKNGSFRFSDRDDPGQQTFFTEMDTDAWHANELARRLSGRVMKEPEMRLFVLTQTPFYRFKKAVRVLRKDGRAVPVKAGEDWPVRFL